MNLPDVIIHKEPRDCALGEYVLYLTFPLPHQGNVICVVPDERKTPHWNASDEELLMPIPLNEYEFRKVKFTREHDGKEVTLWERIR